MTNTTMLHCVSLLTANKHYTTKGPKDSIGYKITRLHFTYIDDAQSGRRAFSSLEAKQTRPKFLALI